MRSPRRRSDGRLRSARPDLRAAGAGPRASEAGLYVHGQRIDLVYRRVLINDMVAREAECRALLDAYEARAVCVANTLRCKIPHKKAFFAVLTDERYARLFSPEERELIRQHVPWTAHRRGRTGPARRQDDRPPRAPARAPRPVRDQAERRVRRHRRDARLGDQRGGVGRRDRRAPWPNAIAAGWRRSASPSGARCFRSARRDGVASATCSSISRRTSFAAASPAS